MIGFTKKVHEIFTKIFVAGSLLIILFYSPSILLEFPLFKIKKIELNVRDTYLKKEVETLINKKYQNNWILLKINEKNFENHLQKKTYFWVEHAKVLSFNPLTGILHLKLDLNKPLFNFNDIYFLSKTGRIFKIKGQNLNLPFLIDRTKNWKLGELYDKTIINQILNLNIEKIHSINIEHLKVSLTTNKIRLSFPRREGNKIDFANYVAKFFPNKKLNLNLFGKKSVAVKIYKE